MQAALRRARGEEATAFERMEDGARSVSKGDVVRLAVKPAVVGAVLHFSVPQVRPFRLPDARRPATGRPCRSFGTRQNLFSWQAQCVHLSLLAFGQHILPPRLIPDEQRSIWAYIKWCI